MMQFWEPVLNATGGTQTGSWGQDPDSTFSYTHMKRSNFSEASTILNWSEIMGQILSWQKTAIDTAGLACDLISGPT